MFIPYLKKFTFLEHGGTESDGYKQLQEQIQVNAKLDKNIALEKERLKILSGENNLSFVFLVNTMLCTRIFFSFLLICTLKTETLFSCFNFGVFHRNFVLF